MIEDQPEGAIQSFYIIKLYLLSFYFIINIIIIIIIVNMI